MVVVVYIVIRVESKAAEGWNKFRKAKTKNVKGINSRVDKLFIQTVLLNTNFYSISEEQTRLIGRGDYVESLAAGTHEVHGRTQGKFLLI